MTRQENARHLLARIHKAHIRAQIDAGTIDVVHIFEARHGLDAESETRALTAVVTRATAEMAIAHALGDRVSRLDLHVLDQIEALFGAETRMAVLDSLRSLDAIWPDTYPSRWPSPLPRAMPTLISERQPWWARAVAWLIGGRS